MRHSHQTDHTTRVGQSHFHRVQPSLAAARAAGPSSFCLVHSSFIALLPIPVNRGPDLDRLPGLKTGR